MPVLIHLVQGTVRFFDATIEPHFSQIAAAVGITRHLFEPDKLGIAAAFQLVGPLTEAIGALEKDAEKLKTIVSIAGRDDHAHLLGWLKQYLAACQRDPKAAVVVTRLTPPEKK